MRILDPVPSEAILKEAKQRLIEAFPVMHDMRVTATWGGAVDVTPDGIPVISAVDSIPGFSSPPASPATDLVYPPARAG